MMGLVCMSLEEMERSVSTGGTVIAFHPHQDCGDVIFLTPVERYRASTSTSVMMSPMVIINRCFKPYNTDILQVNWLMFHCTSFCTLL